MDNATKEMIKGWIAIHGGDTEALARWMRDNLNLGCGIKACRAMIAEATA